MSPISFASKIRTPVLIVNGEDDTNVPVSQAIYLHPALSRYGAEHELVIYPREGHGLVERNHQLDQRAPVMQPDLLGALSAVTVRGRLSLGLMAR